ncbi:TetR/AcrR family transcriptional regulator [Pediococcus siamensis]|uniref:TetR/AcrR family transcriptional regulator n=1 Tax=Pediococcus siamensis TaxID=381829 RepID=UPI0039A3067F
MNDKQQRLYEAAKATFNELGFKKTNIAEITKRAGVAVGTFYRFYNSKEEIFVQLYREENERVKQTVFAANDLDEAPQTLLPRITQQLIMHAHSSLILQAWDANAKVKNLIEKDVPVQQNYLYETISQLIIRWQQQDLLQSKVTAAQIKQLFDALIILDRHRDELEIDDYGQLITDLVQGILALILK